MICILTKEFTCVRNRNGSVSYGYVIFNDQLENDIKTYCDTWTDIPLKEMEILAQIRRDSESNPITKQILELVIEDEDDIYINNQLFSWDEIKEELL
jgi:hypothetical protein